MSELVFLNMHLFHYRIVKILKPLDFSSKVFKIVLISKVDTRHLNAC